MKKTILFNVVLLTAIFGTLASCSEAIEESPVNTAGEENISIENSIEVSEVSYPIIDTNQGTCYDDDGLIDCPSEGDVFYGQDAQYTGISPEYTDNGDGTVQDEVTGLLWTQSLTSSAMKWEDAGAYCEDLEIEGVTDWRLPSLKELWSLRDFSQGWPWIDTDYFYLVGDGSELAQHHSWTSDKYLVESEYQDGQVEGDPAWIVNDWTGHIKAMSGNRFVRCVSGEQYGVNNFVDNSDGTITDEATGLMWSQDDSGEMMYWKEALAYAEDSTLAGYDDWRLPNIKELQSIADNSVTEIPAMNTNVFQLTEVENVVYDGDEQIDTQVNYPFYWSSTSNPVQAEEDDVDGGTIYGWIYSAGYNVNMKGYDLHGAGSIVFVSKSEEHSGIEDSVPIFVRLVRDGVAEKTPEGNQSVLYEEKNKVFPEGDTGMPDRGGEGNQQGGQGQGGPDFAAAAEALGITEEALMNAMGEPGAEPDFASIASSLGITEEELMNALEADNEEERPEENDRDSDGAKTE